MCLIIEPSTIRSPLAPVTPHPMLFGTDIVSYLLRHKTRQEYDMIVKYLARRIHSLSHAYDASLCGIRGSYGTTDFHLWSELWTASRCDLLMLIRHFYNYASITPLSRPVLDSAVARDYCLYLDLNRLYLCLASCRVGNKWTSAATMRYGVRFWCSSAWTGNDKAFI